MRFSDTLLRQVRDRVSIADYAGKRLTFDKRKSRPSAGDYWACCPFHEERTASFHVLDQKGIFHCFGCGERGDVFKLAMRLEDVPFEIAVERLARLAGVQLPSNGWPADWMANPASVLSAATEILNQRTQYAAAAVLSASTIQFEKTGFDNWDGGTDIYTVWGRVEPSRYAAIDSSREEIQEQIEAALKPIIDQKTQAWISVRVAPLPSNDTSRFSGPGPIERDLREIIAEMIEANNIAFSGALKQTEFLARLYDLEKLPSFDLRFETARDDISTHCDSFDDWSPIWIFSDRRFGLLMVSDEEYLRFLCEMLHPRVRPDRGEAYTLAALLNSELQHAGWCLVEEGNAAGRPKYVARPLRLGAAPTKSARHAADYLDANFMHLQISRAEAAIHGDPTLAIGTAKDLVETCCKTLLMRLGVTYAPDLDTPQLANLLLRELNLSPRSVPDSGRGAEILRALLGNFANIPHRLAELRNLYGTGHGKEGAFKGLEAHHAQLAVTSAVAFIHFVVAEYRQREVIVEGVA